MRLKGKTAIVTGANTGRSGETVVVDSTAVVCFYSDFARQQNVLFEAYHTTLKPDVVVCLFFVLNFFYLFLFNRNSPGGRSAGQTR